MAEPVNIVAAIRQIATERKIDVDEILEAIKDAIKTGYRQQYDFAEGDPLEVEFDPDNGSIVVYAKKIIVKKVEQENLEISTKAAKAIDKKLNEGDEVLIDITADGEFGRIAAQTARQVILQKLRESEKESAISELVMTAPEELSFHEFPDTRTKEFWEEPSDDIASRGLTASGEVSKPVPKKPITITFLMKASACHA